MSRAGSRTPSLTVLGYCDVWGDLAAAPHQELTEVQARARHDRGELYTVVLGEGGVAHVLVLRRPEVGYAAVHRLDEHGRETQQYLSSRVAGTPDRRFLQHALTQEYAADAERSAYASPTVVRDLESSPDGTARLTVDDERVSDLVPEDRTMDTSDLYLPVPAFEGHLDLLPPDGERTS